tara:strand:- start:1562 stop:1825 length:264 start_codon:yes stop_codon:yes gene_type:complete
VFFDILEVNYDTRRPNLVSTNRCSSEAEHWSPKLGVGVSKSSICANCDDSHIAIWRDIKLYGGSKPHIAANLFKNLVNPNIWFIFVT